MTTLDDAQIEEISARIKEDPANRDILIEVIAQGKTFPPLARSAAYIAIQQMSPQEVEKFSVVALRALEYAKAHDLDGLIEYLSGLGLPPAMVSIIREYGSNFIKNE